MCEAKLIIVIIRVTAAIVVIMCTSIYFTSGGSNKVDLGDGNDVSKINTSNGIHLLEVDNSNSNGWSWLEIGFVVLALKLGLLISHAFHYFYLTKHLVKKKSRIRETPTLSTDADSRTDTNLKRLRDLSNFSF